jgi:TMEM175 potassium channel family protein
MTKGRLEAYSDAVIAILITIMVLELKVPDGDDSWVALAHLQNTFLSYVLSFVFLSIYWNNHHHMLHLASRVNGRVLWANAHLLFWLSLVPFTTAWMGSTHFAALPAAVYGFVLLMASVGYYTLERTIIRHEGPHSKLAGAVGANAKGLMSVALYLLAMPLAFVNRSLSLAIYVLVALMWLVPDKRIEAMVGRGSDTPGR